MTGKTQGGNKVCKIFVSLQQRTWQTLPCSCVPSFNGSFHSCFMSCWWGLSPEAFGEQGLLDIPGRTRVRIENLCELPVYPTSCLLPCTTTFIFFSWFIPPWNLLFPGNKQLRRSGFFFFCHSTKLCHMPHQTYSNLWRKIPLGGFRCSSGFPAKEPGVFALPVFPVSWSW